MEAIEIRSQNLRATILTHGATLARLLVADRSGLFGDVLLGFSTDAGWTSPTNPCMGCILGRVAGRTSPRLVVEGVACAARERRWGRRHQAGHQLARRPAHEPGDLESAA